MLRLLLKLVDLAVLVGVHNAERLASSKVTSSTEMVQAASVFLCWATMSE